MSIQISSPHCPISPAMRDHVMDSLSKLHKQHPPHMEDPTVRVVLEPAGHRQEATCSLHYKDRNTSYDIAKDNADLYTSIDQTFHALSASIQKQRSRMIR
jgi:ribosomal subunit interface protein